MRNVRKIALYTLGVYLLLGTALSFAEGKRPNIATNGFKERIGNYKVLLNKIDEGRPIVVAYLGGSITEGAMCAPIKGVNKYGEEYDYTAMADNEKYSWRARTFSWLQENYQRHDGQFRMVHAAVGDTHSELAAYRLDDNVLRHKPDLLFVEFAVNDQGKAVISNAPLADNSIYRTMSSIIRRAELATPDLAVLIAVSTKRDLDLSNDRGVALSRRHHIKLANQLGIPYVDVHRVFYNEALPEGVTVRNVFDGPDEAGCNVHPSPMGYKAYAQGVIRVLGPLLDGKGFDFEGERRDFYPDYPVRARFYKAEDLEAQSGWTIRENAEYGRIKVHSLYGKAALTTDVSGSSYKLRFKGSSVFLWGQYHFQAKGITQGVLKVYIDGKLSKTFADSAHLKDGQSPLSRRMPVIHGLDPEVEHELELYAEAKPDGKVLLGIHGICIDEGFDISAEGREILDDSDLSRKK